MNNDLIIVKAKIRLRATEEGGRKTAITSGYRPNHVFEPATDFGLIRAYAGDIRFNDQDCIEPGQTKIVIVRFLPHPAIDQYITTGQQWFMYEVPHLVAEGEIIEIVQR